MPAKKAARRPVHYLLALLAALCILDLSLFYYSMHRRAELRNNVLLFDVVTSGLGLTDLCVSTEARYTRHPAVSDPVVPFMDHPGAREHFPTGSFWVPPRSVPALREY
jgi:hypothetical protein